MVAGVMVTVTMTVTVPLLDLAEGEVEVARQKISFRP